MTPFSLFSAPSSDLIIVSSLYPLLPLVRTMWRPYCSGWWRIWSALVSNHAIRLALPALQSLGLYPTAAATCQAVRPTRFSDSYVLIACPLQPLVRIPDLDSSEQMLHSQRSQCTIPDLTCRKPLAFLPGVVVQEYRRSTI